MQIRKNVLSVSFLALLFGPLAGCGSSGLPTASSPGPTGKVVQGAVSGATVWADAIGAGTQFVLDSSEVSAEASTSSAGGYAFSKTPSYKYALISQGGNDTVTGEKATTLLAPGGAQCVSPLTTLAELDTSDPTGQLETNLNALLPAGENFGADITASGALTPASMVFLTSITIAVTAFDTALQDSAAKSNATLTPQQLDDINLTLYSQMAAEFATLPVGSLANTASLAASLQAALVNAFAAFPTSNPNITIANPSALAASIADNSVATAANVVGIATNNAALASVTAANVQNAPGVPASTSITLTESAVLTGGNVQLVTNDITTVAASVVAAGDIIASSTPSGYSPPTIPIVTNPTIVDYELVLQVSGNEWNVNTFSMTFSDDMVATNSTDAHSALNPANYQFNEGGCTPSSYASRVVTFSCSNLGSDTFVVTTLSATSTGGVEASATSQGLLVNNVKIFNLPSATGSTGGVALF